MPQYHSGETPLVKIDEFCTKFNLPKLLIKDESKNPFGTWKDRRSDTIITRAEYKSVDKLCLITAGNAGFSLSKFASGTGLKVIAIIDIHLASSIKRVLQDACFKVVETNLSERIFKSQELTALVKDSDEEVIWDVTNGFESAYEMIIEEIKDEVPDYLICPVGSGEGFVGLCDGLRKANLDTKLIGISAESKPSIADKLYTPWTPYKNKIEVVLQLGHKIFRLSEEEIKSAYSYAKNYINCEPSSAVVIGALLRLNLKNQDKVIVINSGKGLA